MKKLVGGLLLVLASTGCYTTRIASAGASFDHLPPASVHEDRQWFAFGGLTKLTHSAGRECERGIATASSEYTFTDGLISLGIGAIGGLATLAACNSKDQDTQIACFSAGANLGAFFLGSRTVQYTCLDTGVPEAPNVPVLPSTDTVAPPAQ
jgi:hypothetical protein